jgi:hypothetical protein
MKSASEIHKGVLQGGILSPLLFTLYINDLAELLERDVALKAYFYADDLAVLTKGKANIIRAVETIENWCRQNEMIINNKKCGIMKLHGNKGK